MKNKANKWRIIGILLIPIGIFLITVFASIGEATQSEASPVFYIPIVVILLGVAMYFIATSESRRYCNSCGKSLEGCAYEYQEAGTEAITDALKVTVHIRAKCPHCGEIKSFMKGFYVSGKSLSLQYQVDNFCRSKFGH